MLIYSIFAISKNKVILLRVVMNFCPIFLNMNEKSVLLVGGGKIACRKLKILLNFTKNVVLVSKSFNDEIKEVILNNNLSFYERAYITNEIKNFDLAVIAIDDILLQEEIYLQSKQTRCLCNFADLPHKCDFSFGAHLIKEDLIISISTNGGAPSVIKEFKKWLDKKIPDTLIDFIKEIKSDRKSLKKGEARMDFLKEKTKKFFENLS